MGDAAPRNRRETPHGSEHVVGDLARVERDRASGRRSPRRRERTRSGAAVAKAQSRGVLTRRPDAPERRGPRARRRGGGSQKGCSSPRSRGRSRRYGRNSRSALRSSPPRAFTNSSPPPRATPKYGVDPRASTPAWFQLLQWKSDAGRGRRRRPARSAAATALPTPPARPRWTPTRPPPRRARRRRRASSSSPSPSFRPAAPNLPAATHRSATAPPP